jgi:hypothetical protein
MIPAVWCAPSIPLQKARQVPEFQEYKLPRVLKSTSRNHKADPEEQYHISDRDEQKATVLRLHPTR